MKWSFMYNTFLKAAQALPVTLSMVFYTLLFSVPLAIGLTLIRRKNGPLLKGIISVYMSFIRSVPLILLIYIAYNTLPSILTALLRKLGFGINAWDISPVALSVAVFTLVNVATMSEVFRSALLTVPETQMEAALTVGLTRPQAFFRIILPQALVSALPNLCTLIVLLIKETTLSFAMTVKDVMAVAKIEGAAGYNYIEAYLAVFFIYLFLCLFIEKVFGIAEQRLGQYKKPMRLKES